MSSSQLSEIRRCKALLSFGGGGGGGGSSSTPYAANIARLDSQTVNADETTLILLSEKIDGNINIDNNAIIIPESGYYSIACTVPRIIVINVGTIQFFFNNNDTPITNSAYIRHFSAGQHSLSYNLVISLAANDRLSLNVSTIGSADTTFAFATGINSPDSPAISVCIMRVS